MQRKLHAVRIIVACLALTLLGYDTKKDDYPLDKWAPSSGAVSFTKYSDHASTVITLKWDEHHIPKFPDSWYEVKNFSFTRGIKVKLAVPALKRTDREFTNPKNKLRTAFAIGLDKKRCQYQDVYFQDACEHWGLGLQTTEKNCFTSKLPGTIRIEMETDPIDAEIDSARLVIQRTGYSSKTLEAIGKGGLCSGGCAVCFKNNTWDNSDPFCAWAAKKAKGIDQLCGECPKALLGDPAWTYFTLSEIAVCAEPVCLSANETKFDVRKKGCFVPMYDTSCDGVIRQDQGETACYPQKISCGPGLTWCKEGVLTTCNNQGNRLVRTTCPTRTCASTTKCSAQGGISCNPGTTRCVAGTLFTCNMLGTAETSAACPSGLCQDTVSCKSPMMGGACGTGCIAPLVCSTTGCVPECGVYNRPCCEPGASCSIPGERSFCDARSGFNCNYCGSTNQPCCPGADPCSKVTMGLGVFCETMSGYCWPCGMKGTRCCETGTPCQAGTMCYFTKGTNDYRCLEMPDP